MFLLALLGLTSVFSAWARSGFHPSASEGIDNRLNNYLLEHGYQLLLDVLQPGDVYPGKPLSPPMFHPEPETFAYSENLLGLAPIYWLSRTVLEPWAAFNAWVAVGFVATFAAMVWACRRLGAGGVASLVAGFLYAFGMPRLVQHEVSHSQLVPSVFAPLAVVTLWSFLHRPRHRTLAALLGLLWWQLATGIYLGWFLLLGVVGAGVLGLMLPGRLRNLWHYLRHGWPGAIGISIVFILATAALLWPYWQARRSFGGWDEAYIYNTLPRWHSYLRPAPDTLWWEPLRHLSAGDGYVVELHLFLGFAWLPLLVLAAAFAIHATFRPSANRAVEAENDSSHACQSHFVLWGLAVAAALTLVTFSLPSGRSVWWHVYEALPGGTSIRAVSRVWTVSFLFALLATAVGADAAIHRLRGALPSHIYRVIVGVVLLLTVIAIVEQVKWPRRALRVNEFDEQVAGTVEVIDQRNWQPGEAFFLFPPALPPGAGDREAEIAMRNAHIVAMWASMKTDIPTINGYSARSPAGYPAHSRIPSTEALDTWMERAGDGTAVLLQLRRDTDTSPK